MSKAGRMPRLNKTAQYRPIQRQKVNDAFSARFREINENFAERSMGIVGESAREVIGNQNLYNEYVAQLLENVDDPVLSETLQTLLINGRTNMLQESMAGLSPIASFTPPMIYKMWARVALKTAFPTEPIPVPSFYVTYNKPYMITPDGERVELPEGSKGISHGHGRLTPLGVNGIFKTPAQWKNFSLIDAVGGQADSGTQGASTANADSVDRDIRLMKVRFQVPKGANDDTDGAKLEIKEITINSQLTNTNTFYAAVKAKGTNATGQDVVYEDMVFGHVDLRRGILNIRTNNGAVAGALGGFGVTQISIKGGLSSEWNNRGYSVGFDTAKEEVTIGTGQPIFAPLSDQFLQDISAIYNIDGTVEVIEIMSNVMAQHVDQEMIAHLINSMDQLGDDYAATFRRTFSLTPRAPFVGSPKDWKEEIKPQLDWLANQLRVSGDYIDGYFVIVGNPVDAAILPNVNWTFTDGTQEVAGVPVNFSIGAISGPNRYQIVSTTNFPEGFFIMFFVPTTANQLSFRYYPYSFNVRNDPGFRDPNHPNVPSVSMIRRDTIFTVTPIIARLDIEGNDGTIPGHETWQ